MVSRAEVKKRIGDALKDRAIWKAVSYRVCGTLFLMLMVWLTTGIWELTVLAIGWDGGKIVLYYLHEKFWDKVVPRIKAWWLRF